jgi:hypothetical protein
MIRPDHVPEKGWYIERNANTHYTARHRLWLDGDVFGWLTDEMADSFPGAGLPEGVELAPTATGAWLAENDPHGERWERNCGSSGWVANHQNATPDWSYVVRPVQAPPEPEIERVQWWEAIGRRLPSGDKIGSLEADHSGVVVYGRMGERLDCSLSDGTVEVLRESGVS